MRKTLGEYEILRNYESDGLHKTLYIVRIIKSYKRRWARHVARTGADRTARRISPGKPKSKRSLGRQKWRWEDNVAQNLNEIGRDQISCAEFAQNRKEWCSLVEEVMTYVNPMAP